MQIWLWWTLWMDQGGPHYQQKKVAYKIPKLFFELPGSDSSSSTTTNCKSKSKFLIHYCTSLDVITPNNICQSPENIRVENFI